MENWHLPFRVVTNMLCNALQMMGTSSPGLTKRHMGNIRRCEQFYEGFAELETLGDLEDFVPS